MAAPSTSKVDRPRIATRARSVHSRSDLLLWYWQRLEYRLQPSPWFWLAAVVIVLLLFMAPHGRYFRPSALSLTVALSAALVPLLMRVRARRGYETQRDRRNRDWMAALLWAPLWFAVVALPIASNLTHWLGHDGVEERGVAWLSPRPGSAVSGRYGCAQFCDTGLVSLGDLPLAGELRTCLAAGAPVTSLRDAVRPVPTTTSWFGTLWTLPNELN